ncbi:hypothetical protein [Sagittula sp. SSi028]|uniref:hypothetical protein n=1 Tax=Sagittula sp. SSi028 TaxID=3400636 RepID=UPI003AF6618B
MRRTGLIALLLPIAAQAQEAIYEFSWDGAGGYSLQGAVAVDRLRDETALITQDDVSCFYIKGRLGDREIGEWGLGLLNEETWWRMLLDPQVPAFLVEGMGAQMPQAWNMDGFGTSCGAGGFGFNIGSAAQDLCIDGQLIVDSQIDPFRPFPVTPVQTHAFPAYACRGVDLLSQLDLE